MFWTFVLDFAVYLIGSAFAVGTVWAAAQLGRLIYRFASDEGRTWADSTRPVEKLKKRPRLTQLPPSLARELHAVGARLHNERGAS